MHELVYKSWPSHYVNYISISFAFRIQSNSKHKGEWSHNSKSKNKKEENEITLDLQTKSHSPPWKASLFPLTAFALPNVIYSPQKYFHLLYPF